VYAKACELALSHWGGRSPSGKFTKREWQVKSIAKRFPAYENNFRLAVGAPYATA
jgi:hypothetical protein